MPERKPTRTADLDYFYGQSSELFSFYRIPKLLFQDSRFQPLSTDAKTLYGILLDRMSLSARNGWLDKAGRVFIIYTVQEVQDSLGCADKKATKLLRKLEEYGLIKRKRRGLGKPDLIYVKNFSSESSTTPYLNRNNDDSGTVQNTLQDPAKLRCNKSERNNTEVSDTDPIYSDENDWMSKRTQLEEYFSQSLEIDLLLRLYPDDEDMADSLSMAFSPENIKSSHDVFISLFGELKIHTSHGVLPESDLKSPKISRLLTFMLLSNKKALSSLEIVQEIWPEELEDKDEPGKKVKQLVYRLRQAFSIISDEQLILSTPSGYQFNPDLHITTDFQRFDELCIAAAKATSAINKVRLLEKAASLYQGKLLSAANGEHWLVHYANRYHLAFMSTVNELLKQLMDFHAYDLLHRDAALALTIAPENTKAYYWLIRSYQKQHMDEMVVGELAAAKQKLPEDEYQKLLSSLEQ